MEFEVGSLSAHCQAQNGKERPPQWVTLLATAYISIHRVSFPKSVGSIRCPVGGLQGGVGDDVYQPPDTLRALPCAGHGSDSGGREPPPPPLSSL